MEERKAQKGKHLNSNKLCKHEQDEWRDTHEPPQTKRPNKPLIHLRICSNKLTQLKCNIGA